jgi:translation elongation factor EF-Tu-like GTPase
MQSISGDRPRPGRPPLTAETLTLGFRNAWVTGSLQLPDDVASIAPGDTVTAQVTLLKPVAMANGLEFDIRAGRSIIGQRHLRRRGP